MGRKKGYSVTEVQQRNYCLFIVKGGMAHRPFLAPHVSSTLLDKLQKVQEEILEELHLSILNHKQEHSHGTT